MDISVHYDPLIAKLIVHGERREAARRRAVAALRDFHLLGVRTNVPFLIALLEHPQFADGRIDTGFLDREGNAIAAGLESSPPLAALAAAAVHRDNREAVPAPVSASRPPADPFVALRGWRGR